MKSRTTYRCIWVVSGLLLAATPASSEEGGKATATQGEYQPEFDTNGALVQPADYLWRRWVYVGTPLTPNSLNPPEASFPEFHNVYMRTSDFEHWQRTGKFRDGTMLIKELVSVGKTEALSGKGFFQGEFIGLEASIKDSKRFAKEPGNWGYFTFSHAKPPYPAIAKQQATASCNACHLQGNQQGEAEDYVFLSYYPVLRASRPGGKP